MNRKKLTLTLSVLLLGCLAVTAQDNNVALFFYSTAYESADSTGFMAKQANTIKSDLMYDYGFRASAYDNYSKLNLMNSIENECAVDSTRKDKQLFVYIGGQSVMVEDTPHLVLHDSKKDDAESMVNMQNLLNILGNCDARNVLLFLDAPNSGTLGSLEQVKTFEVTEPDSTLTKEAMVSKSFEQQSLIIVANSSEAFEDGIRNFSPLTSKLLEAIRSYGEADGVLTLEEISYYVSNSAPPPLVGTIGESSYQNFLFIVK